MIAKPDEFEKHARAVLKGDPGLADRLLVLRKEVQQEGNEAWSKSRTPTAAELNAANRRMIDRAASLLGPANFERVFGFAPTAKFNLVDPQMMRAQTLEAKTAPHVRGFGPYDNLTFRKKESRPADAMTKAGLIDSINKSTHLSKKDVKEVLETLTVIGHKELKKRGVFLVPGFAKFVVIKKPATKARKVINPFTGEQMIFKARPPRKVLRARPVKTAKEAVKNSLRSRA